MTPALLARIQPSDADRVRPCDIPRLLAEAKAELVRATHLYALVATPAASPMQPTIRLPRYAAHRDPAIIGAVARLASEGKCQLEIARAIGRSEKVVHAVLVAQKITCADGRIRHVMQPKGGRGLNTEHRRHAAARPLDALSTYPPLTRSTGG